MSDRAPPVANIQQRAVSLIRYSVANNTGRAYDNALRNFKRFRAVYGMTNEWPIPINQLILYVAYCFEKNYAPSTIALYMSSISFLHKIKGFYNPSESFVIRKMLEGCKRLRHRQDFRAPISLSMLNRLVALLSNVCYTEYESSLFEAAFYLAYFGLFRISELVVCSNLTIHRALTKSDVTFESETSAVIIRLRVSKTNQTGKPVFVRIPSSGDTKICISALQKYAKIASSNSEQFFCHANGKPLTRYQFSSVLSKTCKQAGFNSKILTHSFRIGRATDLALQGLSDDKIKMMGRWSSNSYARYIRT